MRTRSSPILSVRQTASPVSPGCVVAGCLLQSVTVNGRAGIFMAISLCLAARIVACAEAGEVRNAKEADDCGSGDRGAAGDLAVSRELVRHNLSSPAKAGDPVFQRPAFEPSSRGVLDRPVKPGDD